MLQLESSNLITHINETISKHDWGSIKKKNSILMPTVSVHTKIPHFSNILQIHSYSSQSN